MALGLSRRLAIEEKLGEGGMGVVYRARDEHLQRDVAIKVLAAGTLADQAARNRNSVFLTTGDERSTRLAIN